MVTVSLISSCGDASHLALSNVSKAVDVLQSVLIRDRICLLTSYMALGVGHGALLTAVIH